MDPIWMMVGLIAVGLVLIGVDFYLPGFVLGSIGIVLMLAALVLCYRHYGVSWAAGLFLFEAITGGVTAYVSVKFVPHTATGRKMILSLDQTAQRASNAPASELVGREGVAQTLLRPSGMAVLDGKRLDVVAESGIIERGSPIKVVAVDGTRIVVRKV